MNKSNVKQGPPSFALAIILGVALSGYARITMMAIITYLTWWIGREIFGLRATTEASSTSVLSEEEIGITPRMVEAGAFQLMQFDSRFSSFEDGALKIYRVHASRKKCYSLGEASIIRWRLGNPDAIMRWCRYIKKACDSREIFR